MFAKLKCNHHKSIHQNTAKVFGEMTQIYSPKLEIQLVFCYNGFEEL